MRKLISFVLLTCVCAISLAVVCTVKAAASDQSQIQALYQRFATAFRNRDLNGVMSVYVHDDSLFVFDITPPRQYIGWNAYREDWRNLFSTLKGPVNFSILDSHITTSGDVAYTHSAQDLRARMANGHMVHLIVRVTDVLRRMGGKWLIVQEHVSVPVDIATGKADLLSKP
jgi:ketosteroid isomerase-like protein